MEKKITLTANGQAFDFNVTTMTYDLYLNELGKGKLTAAAKNFLMRSVTPESKDGLKEFLELPSASVHLAAALVEEFTPDIEISVGK